MISNIYEDLCNNIGCEDAVDMRIIYKWINEEEGRKNVILVHNRFTEIKFWKNAELNKQCTVIRIVKEEEEKKWPEKLRRYAPTKGNQDKNALKTYVEHQITS